MTKQPTGNRELPYTCALLPVDSDERRRTSVHSLHICQDSGITDDTRHDTVSSKKKNTTPAKVCIFQHIIDGRATSVYVITARVKRSTAHSAYIRGIATDF